MIGPILRAVYHTGLTKSQILRILLEIAEVQPTVFTLNLAKIEGQPQQELQHA